MSPSRRVFAVRYLAPTGVLPLQLDIAVETHIDQLVHQARDFLSPELSSRNHGIQDLAKGH